MDISILRKETKRRLKQFDAIRGHTTVQGTFWDVVVLTAVDNRQKCSYELQLKKKIETNQLPLSAKYIVVADPKGAKIGNGGSTFVVIEHLYGLYKEETWNKKVIIVHAGGFSQRLPNASLLGKAFTAIPVGNPMYQTLELKLASYIDFPSKIVDGGIFVCCADTVEVYNDDGLPWKFSTEGFTALAHMSPISIGTTHGVFVLDSPKDGSDVIWKCRKFLHKPSAELMVSTDNCVIDNSSNKQWVLTDSAFFMSVNVAKVLLEFFKDNQPLTCEIDAYGDFLQALGTESSPEYVTDVKNVCYETNSLVQLRRQVYDVLKDTPLYVVVLAPVPEYSKNIEVETSNVSSIFYHIGTMPEYLFNMTADEGFRSILGIKSLSSCKGMPHEFTSTAEFKYDKVNSIVQLNKHGAISCTIRQLQLNPPCILGSVIHAKVTIGEGSIIEYSYLHESVTIGDSCIISNCSLPAASCIPPETFLHTASINVDDQVLFVTIMFSITDDLKKTAPASQVMTKLSYFGFSLEDLFLNANVCGDKTNNLWTAALFPASQTLKESCLKACLALKKIAEHKKGDDVVNLYQDGEKLYSMKEILERKNVQRMLNFRADLLNEIDSVSNSSHINHVKAWANEI